MKKWYEIIVKAIEVTKKYEQSEVKLLAWLFSYLNNIDIDEEWFKTWVSAKWLWKLLNPLTRTWKKQEFREWWESVSNLSRLKENRDFEVREETILRNISDKPSFAWRENSQTSKDGLNKWRWWKRESYFAKDFFTKDGLLDLEKLENKLAVIIEYLSPKTRDDLKSLIVDFLNKEVKLGVGV